ncbi:hypothetical protein F5I97DRAFT_931358 [Phlebopus sp. FC_14]|nr:hypothetical protein F5I97DRAFT_931358 [Phlebopus sp. FC_14]
MQVRVYAMYCNSRARAVLRIMLCCFFIEIASTSILLGLHMNSTASIVAPTCSLKFSEKDFLTFYIPILSFESVLLLLVLYAVLQHLLDTRRMCGVWRINPFMKTLTLYSVLYFLVYV